MNILIEKKIKERVKKIAAAQGRLYNEVWRDITLERWLVRLCKSPYKKQFIFKGGMCLSQYLNIGRETKDLDFLIKGITGSIENLQKITAEIAALEIDDGFIFEAVTVSSLAHRHMKYPGYELSMRVSVGSTRSHIRIDIGIGDQVTPENMTYELSENVGSPLFEKDIDLWAYTPEAIFSEKYETAIRRSAINCGSLELR